MARRGFKAWCEELAIHLRDELQLAPIDPLDPRRLAEQLEIEVHSVNEIPGIDSETLRTLTIDGGDSWSAITLSTPTKALVVLNPSHRGGRPASNLMHELAHLLIGHKPARADVTEDNLLVLNTYDREQEDEATWLAGCLLLPRAALVHIRRIQMSPASAARTYGVSAAMLQYRLNVTGVENQFRRAGRYARK